jgi:hypothetical protein
MWGTVAFVILRRTRNRPLTPRPPRLKQPRVAADQPAPRIGEDEAQDG